MTGDSARRQLSSVKQNMADPLLPQTVLRGIGDKLYDKRKHAALEVEQVGAAEA